MYNQFTGQFVLETITSNRIDPKSSL